MVKRPKAKAKRPAKRPAKRKAISPRRYADLIDEHLTKRIDALSELLTRLTARIEQLEGHVGALPTETPPAAQPSADEPVTGEQRADGEAS